MPWGMLNSGGVAIAVSLAVMLLGKDSRRRQITTKNPPLVRSTMESVCYSKQRHGERFPEPRPTNKEGFWVTVSCSLTGSQGAAVQQPRSRNSPLFVLGSCSLKPASGFLSDTATGGSRSYESLVYL